MQTRASHRRSGGCERRVRWLCPRRRRSVGGARFPAWLAPNGERKESAHSLPPPFKTHRFGRPAGPGRLRPRMCGWVCCEGEVNSFVQAARRSFAGQRRVEIVKRYSRLALDSLSLQNSFRWESRSGRSHAHAHAQHRCALCICSASLPQATRTARERREHSCEMAPAPPAAPPADADAGQAFAYREVRELQPPARAGMWRKIPGRHCHERSEVGRGLPARTQRKQLSGARFSTFSLPIVFTGPPPDQRDLRPRPPLDQGGAVRTPLPTRSRRSSPAARPLSARFGRHLWIHLDSLHASRPGRRAWR